MVKKLYGKLVTGIKKLYSADWFSGNFQITRFLIVRLMGLMYFVAFLIIVEQGLPLLGDKGILPIDRFFHFNLENYNSVTSAFLDIPTLFWFHYSDIAFLSLAWVGVALSTAVLMGCSNAFILLILWFLYLSYANVGQIWYGYGWESQLLETGFLVSFLCPWTSFRPFPQRGTPVPIIWLMRWLTFRIMLGSGLIKIRGDECWTKLTCLNYHFETQPIPHFLSPYFHFLPNVFKNFGVLFNHLAELVAPFFVFGPRLVRLMSGVIMLSFQIILIMSGNLSFLNWLTIIPILACFDDRFWKTIWPDRLRLPNIKIRKQPISGYQKIITTVIFIAVLFLSYYPVLNLISPNQIMNTSFTPLRIVNTYGAFGSVGKRRLELVVEGTRNGTVWREYDFMANPGPIDEPPPWISPYHYRLDWQIWFAAMSQPRRHAWLVKFVRQLLKGENSAMQLIEGNPFPNSPPTKIRIVRYIYRFTNPYKSNNTTWDRVRVGTWLPAVTKNDPRLIRFLENYKLLKNYDYEGLL